MYKFKETELKAIAKTMNLIQTQIRYTDKAYQCAEEGVKEKFYNKMQYLIKANNVINLLTVSNFEDAKNAYIGELTYETIFDVPKEILEEGLLSLVCIISGNLHRYMEDKTVYLPTVTARKEHKNFFKLVGDWGMELQLQLPNWLY